MNDMIGGTFAGMAQVFVGYPFDTAKVHYVKYDHRGLVDFWQSFQQTKKWRSLYRGVLSPMYGSIAINIQTFYFYGALKAKLENPAVSGSIVGASLALVETPVDLIKSRMQTSNKTYQLCIKEIISNEGYIGFYRGLIATTLRNTISVGSMFWGYEKTKMLFPNNPLLGSFAGGFVAGGLCWTLSYPLDNLKTRIQTEKIPTKQSLINRAKSIGWRNMWRGYVPCIIRGVIVNPFIFLAYEIGSSYCKNKS